MIAIQLASNVVMRPLRVQPSALDGAKLGFQESNDPTGVGKAFSQLNMCLNLGSSFSWIGLEAKRGNLLGLLIIHSSALDPSLP